MNATSNNPAIVAHRANWCYPKANTFTNRSGTVIYYKTNANDRTKLLRDTALHWKGR